MHFIRTCCHINVDVKAGCEAMVHGIQAELNVHPNCVVLKVDIANAFNSILYNVIFQELWAIGG
jgi:hypothetical protein